MTRPDPSKDGSAPNTAPDPAPALSPPGAYACLNSAPAPAPGRHVLPIDPANPAPELSFTVPSSATPEAPVYARVWSLTPFLSPRAQAHMGNYLATLALWRAPGECEAAPAEIRVEDDARPLHRAPLAEAKPPTRRFDPNPGSPRLIVELTDAAAEPSLGPHWRSF